MKGYRTIVSAIENGSGLDVLRTLQKKVAKTIDGTHAGRDVASLSRQLTLITIEIDRIEKGETTSESKTPAATVLELVRAKHQRQA